MTGRKAALATSSEIDPVVQLEQLAGSWLAMERATTRDAIEAAAVEGLREAAGVPIAYTARREDAVWTISAQIGLSGNVAGVAIPESLVPYASALNAGETICFERAGQMGRELARSLEAIGLGSLFAVPIMEGGACVGGMAIGAPGPSMFSARDRALVRLFTSHLSVLLSKRDLLQSLETIAESVPAIVLRTDPSGWINWYNNRWYSFTGQTKEEAAGWGWQTAHHPEDFLRVMEEWPKALQTGQAIEIEFRLRRYDGLFHWHLARVEPIRDDKGKIISWYGTVVDIEAQKQALERSTRVSEALQGIFLPETLPQRERLRLDAIYVSAEQDALVGGDWYDAFELPDGRMALSIGDVAGHGLEASLAVGKLRQSIFTATRRSNDPAEVLAEINGILIAQAPGTFVTALVGFIDSAGQTLTYATAGHPPPIIARPGDATGTTLAIDGPPLGVMENIALKTHVVPAPADTAVVLYTDGVTECARNVVAGEKALCDALPSIAGNTRIADPARRLYDAVVQGVTPRDDSALLVLQFSPVSTMAGVREPTLGKEWRFHASDAKAAHVARREIADYLNAEYPDEADTFYSELIVGELLANTVAHAPGLVYLKLEWTGEHFVLIVRDSGPGLTALRASLPDDPMDEGARGLFLVHALSSNVSVSVSPGGGAELSVVLPLPTSDRQYR